jgi:hypothetical protein
MVSIQFLVCMSHTERVEVPVQFSTCADQRVLPPAVEWGGGHIASVTVDLVVDRTIVALG